MDIKKIRKTEWNKRVKMFLLKIVLMLLVSIGIFYLIYSSYNKKKIIGEWYEIENDMQTGEKIVFREDKTFEGFGEDGTYYFQNGKLILTCFNKETDLNETETYRVNGHSNDKYDCIFSYEFEKNRLFIKYEKDTIIPWQPKDIFSRKVLEGSKLELRNLK